MDGFKQKAQSEKEEVEKEEDGRVDSAGGGDDQEGDGGKDNGVEGVLSALGLAGHKLGDEVEEDEQTSGLKIERREGWVLGPEVGQAKRKD